MMSHNSHLFLPYNALFLTFNCMVKVVNLWVRVSKGWSWWLGCCVILIVPFLGIERFWGLGSFCLNWSLLSRVVSPILRVCRWCALLILGAWKENACEAVAILFKFSGHFGEWIFYDFLPPYSCQIEFHWDHLNRHCHGPYLFFLVVLQCGQILCSPNLCWLSTSKFYFHLGKKPCFSPIFTRCEHNYDYKKLRLFGKDFGFQNYLDFPYSFARVFFPVVLVLDKIINYCWIQLWLNVWFEKSVTCPYPLNRRSDQASEGSSGIAFRITT